MRLRFSQSFVWENEDPEVHLRENEVHLRGTAGKREDFPQFPFQESSESRIKGGIETAPGQWPSWSRNCAKFVRNREFSYENCQNSARNRNYAAVGLVGGIMPEIVPASGGHPKGRCLGRVS